MEKISCQSNKETETKTLYVEANVINMYEIHFKVSEFFGLKIKSFIALATNQTNRFGQKSIKRS